MTRKDFEFSTGTLNNWLLHAHHREEIHSEQNILGMRATGRTFSEEPMTIKRSTSSLSCFMALWNISGRFSPKKTMSGFMIAKGISGHRGQCGTNCKRKNTFY